MGLIIDYQEIEASPYASGRRPSVVKRLLRIKSKRPNEGLGFNHDNYFIGGEANPMADRPRQAIAELPASSWIRRFAASEPVNVAKPICRLTAAWAFPNNQWHFDCTLEWDDLPATSTTSPSAPVKRKMRAFWFKYRKEYLSKGREEWGWQAEWEALGINVARNPLGMREGDLFVDVTDPDLVSLYRDDKFVDDYLDDG